MNAPLVSYVTRLGDIRDKLEKTLKTFGILPEDCHVYRTRIGLSVEYSFQGPTHHLVWGAIVAHAHTPDAAPPTIMIKLFDTKDERVVAVARPIEANLWHVSFGDRAVGLKQFRDFVSEGKVSNTVAASLLTRMARTACSGTLP